MKAILDYLLGNVLGRVLFVFLTPILTRTLTVEEYGVLGYFNALSSFLMIIVSLNFPFSLSRAYYDDSSDDSMHKYLSGYVVLQFFWVLFLGVCILMAWRHLKWVEILAFVVAFLKIFGTVFYHLFQPRGGSRYILKRQIIETVLLFVFILFFVFYGSVDGYYSVILGQIVAFSLLLFYIVFSIKKLYPNYSFIWIDGVKCSRGMFFYSVSLLGFSSVCAFLYQFDRLWLGWKDDDVLLGLHSLAFTIGWMYKVLSVSIIGAFSPKLMVLLNEKRIIDFSLIFIILLSSFSVLGVVFYAFSPLFVSVLGGSIYEGSIKYINWFLILFYLDFCVQLLLIYLNHARLNRYASASFGVALLVAIVALFINGGDALLYVCLAFFIGVVLIFLTMAFCKIPLLNVMFTFFVGVLFCFYQSVIEGDIFFSFVMILIFGYILVRFKSYFLLLVR